MLCGGEISIALIVFLSEVAWIAGFRLIVATSMHPQLFDDEEQ